MALVTAFDLDLTLIDSRPSILHALTAVAQRAGEPIVPGRFEAGVRGRVETSFAEWYPTQDAAALGDLYRSIYSDEAMHLATLLPGALESLRAARSFGRLIVITGKFEPTARLHLEQLDLVADAVVGWRHGPLKADTMRELGVSVYVGDQVEDMHAARAAGATAIGVTTGLDDRAALFDAGADHVLDSLVDFPALLATLAAYGTDRLIGFRIAPGDFDELSVLHHDERVMATLGGIRHDDETRQFIREKAAHWDRHGFGMVMFRDRSTGDFVGRGGLQHIEVGGAAEVEVGYTVRAESKGRGYGTEIARRLVAVAFEQLGLDNVVAFTLPDNIASRRVMDKAGFTFERDVEHAGLPHVLYRIRRA